MNFRFNPIADFEEQKKNQYEALARKGWMRFREFRGLPMVVVNHLDFPKQPLPTNQYLNLEVDGVWIYELNHLVIDVAPVGSPGQREGKSIQPWGVRAHLMDGWPRKQDEEPGRPLFLEVSSRSLYFQDFATGPIPGQIREQVRIAVGALAEVDLTPERELLEQRKSERDQFHLANPVSDRESYEKACSMLGCRPMTDKEANSFRSNYYHGAAGYTSLDAMGMARVDLHLKYGAIVRAIKESKKPFSCRLAPDETSPIWEDCENAGLNRPSCPFVCVMTAGRSVSNRNGSARWETDSRRARSG